MTSSLQRNLVLRCTRPVVATLLAFGLAAGAARAQVVDPNMSVTDGYVYAVALVGNTIYLGGNFTHVGPTTGIGGQYRNNLAALDATTGLPTAWNPGSDNTVWTLAVNASTVYAGGSFDVIGGQSRRHLAALDATTGLATAWNPGASGLVRTLAVSGSTVYVGGNFAFLGVGDKERNNIGALDASSGIATAWDPRADYPVNVLKVSGSTVYVGGSFTNIGRQSRSCIAALDAGTGLATAWNPGADISVDALAVSGSTVYAGGNFDFIGGQSRSYIAALDAATGLATAWNPKANFPIVQALAVSGSTVYAGGNFTTIGGQSCGRLAALDATTGLASLAWNPGADNAVLALAVSGSTVYAGGGFSSIGGQSRRSFAAIQDLPTPTLLARFEAVATNGGIQLVWQFDEPDRVLGATLERAPNQVGPWMALALERRGTTAATEALDGTAAGGQTYFYRLTADLTDGTRAVFGPISAAALLAAKVSGLTGIVPNPASSSARIDFALARQEQVRISVVDVAGREAALLVDGPMAPGTYSLRWDGRDESARVPAGVYYVRWASLGASKYRKLVVLW